MLPETTETKNTVSEFYGIAVILRKMASDFTYYLNLAYIIYIRILFMSFLL